MNVQLSEEFIEKYKKANIRIRKHIDEKLSIFRKNHQDLSLNNHLLKREYEGYRSIDITADCRAIFEEEVEGGETFAYFIIFGTHDELYRK